MLVEIADDVELDAAFAQDLVRAARMASAGVVVHQQAVHDEERTVRVVVGGRARPGQAPPDEMLRDILMSTPLMT